MSSHSSVRHAVILVFVDLTGQVDLKVHCRLVQSMSNIVKCVRVVVKRCEEGTETIHAAYSGDRSSSSGRKRKRKKDELQSEFFLKQSAVSAALQNMTGFE